MKTLLIGLIGLCITANAWATGPFSVNAARDIDITTTRASNNFGWQIEAQTDCGDLLASVIDKNEAYTQYPYIVSGTDGLTWYFRGLGEPLDITAGDSVTFTYLTEAGGGEVSEKIFFPAITSPILLYVGDDNCTYSDSAFTTKVGMTPTPAPTATAVVPTATPTAVPPTPTPTPTPEPDSAYLYLIPTATSPGLVGSLWMDTDGVMWFNSTGTDIQVSP